MKYFIIFMYLKHMTLQICKYWYILCYGEPT